MEMTLSAVLGFLVLLVLQIFIWWLLGLAVRFLIARPFMAGWHTFDAKDKQ